MTRDTAIRSEAVVTAVAYPGRMTPSYEDTQEDHDEGIFHAHVFPLLSMIISSKYP